MPHCYNVKAVWRCGCSSMVESQPSKLIVRVRFPLPAPMYKGWNSCVLAFLFLKIKFMEWCRSGHNGVDSKSIVRSDSPVGSNPTHSAKKYL